MTKLDTLSWLLPTTDNYSIAFPIACVVLAVFIWEFSRSGAWQRLVKEKKLSARILLSILLVAFTYSAQGTTGWIYFAAPGQIKPENPSTVSTSVKLALYGKARDEALKRDIAQAQSSLVECIASISKWEAVEALAECDKPDACNSIHLPIPSRQAIVEKIRIVQKDNSQSPSRTACETVDTVMLH